MGDAGTPTHRVDELKRALLAIRELRARVRELEERGRAPIAIVGVACRLPGGADTPERFWELLRAGADATTEVPPDRWDVDALYDPDPDVAGTMYVRRGGFLQMPLDRFDATFFGISPREAAAMDPVQRLVLELSWEALERAAISPQSLDGTETGVFLGASGGDYETLQQRDGSLGKIGPYRGTGTAACVMAGRVSYFLGLRGPSIAVDTACSSSLVAVALAVEQLRAGRCNLALAGGAHLMLAPEAMVLLCRMRALSPSGRCSTFDASADGYARGEGGVIFVLKRLADAQLAGDTIHAVIRGVATNHDGRSSALTVPNVDAQRRVIRAALADAGMPPGDVGYVEAHGTATPLGDPIEVGAIADVLCGDRSADAPLVLGSAKTNLGHLEAAAGAAGLLKAVLCIAHGEIPAHLNCATPTPHVDWSSLPIHIATELMPWRSTTARVAGVSAFGFSGTNAHVIVSEPPPVSAAPAITARSAELVLVSGKTAESVRALAGAYAAWLEERDDSAVADLSMTTMLGRSVLSHRAAVVGAGAAALASGLRALASGEATIARTGGRLPPSIAFLFSGQGSQHVAMGRELYDSSAVFRAAVDRCATIADPLLGRSLVALLTADCDERELMQTALAQPALFAFEYALAELWRSWGIDASFVAGHSLGEYVAATFAGVFELEDALPLVILRGRLMQALPPGGAMAAVFASEETVADALRARATVAIAAVNAPNNIVISGEAGAVRDVTEAFALRGIKSRDLEVSHAFHSALMDPILAEYESAVGRVVLAAPRIPLISNLTGEPLTEADARAPARWRAHVRQPVQFARSVRALASAGVSVFLEIGPHTTLTALGPDIGAGADALWLHSMRRGSPAWPQMLSTLAELFRAGVEIDWAKYARECPGRRRAVPTYPFERQPHWFVSRDVAPPTQGVSALALEWVRAQAAAAPATDFRGVWALIGCERSALSNSVIAEIERRGGHAIWLPTPDGARAENYASEVSSALAAEGVARNHALAGLLHLGALDSPARAVHTGADIVAAAVDLLAPLLVLPVLLSVTRSVKQLRIVTRGAVEADCARGSHYGAALWGALSVLRAEHPDIDARIADVDPALPVDAQGMLATLVASIDEDRWIERNGSSYAPRLVKPTLAMQISIPVIRADATYIVTGATGGIGRLVVEWLVRSGARAVILNSRHEPDEDQHAWMTSHNANGRRIVWHGGDIGDSAVAQRVVAGAVAMGHPVRGVFHTAGITDDALLHQQNRARFGAVLHAKVAGAWALDAATDGLGLEHFVLFSSVAALFGEAGQSGYAAANALLGSLAADRRARGHPATLVDWGPWSGGGMASRLSAALRQRFSSRGVKFIDPGIAFERLSELLAQRRSYAIVAAIDWARAAASTATVPPMLRGLVGEETKRNDEPVAAANFLALGGDARRARAEEYVRRCLASVLGLKFEELAPDVEIAHLGFDSLSAIEVRNRIEKDTGVHLAVVKLLSAVTARDVADEILLAKATPTESAASTGRDLSEGEI